MHDGEDRNLLYFNVSNKPPFLVDEIHQAGWNVKLAKNVLDAQNVLLKCAPHVAIAQFDELNNSFGTSVESFFRNVDHVEWVALLPKNCMNKSHIKR